MGPRFLGLIKFAACSAFPFLLLLHYASATSPSGQRRPNTEPELKKLITSHTWVPDQGTSSCCVVRCKLPHAFWDQNHKSRPFKHMEQWNY